MGIFNWFFGGSKKSCLECKYFRAKINGESLDDLKYISSERYGYIEMIKKIIVYNEAEDLEGNTVTSSDLELTCVCNNNYLDLSEDMWSNVLEDCIYEDIYKQEGFKKI